MIAAVFVLGRESQVGVSVGSWFVGVTIGRFGRRRAGAAVGAWRTR